MTSSSYCWHSLDLWLNQTRLRAVAVVLYVGCCEQWQSRLFVQVAR